MKKATMRATRRKALFVGAYSGLDERMVTGQMDRSISEMIQLTKETTKGHYDDVTQQTLKHHAEDMMLAGQTMLKLLGKTDKEIVSVITTGENS